MVRGLSHVPWARAPEACEAVEAGQSIRLPTSARSVLCPPMTKGTPSRLPYQRVRSPAATAVGSAPCATAVIPRLSGLPVSALSCPRLPWTSRGVIDAMPCTVRTTASAVPAVPKAASCADVVSSADVFRLAPALAVSVPVMSLFAPRLTSRPSVAVPGTTAFEVPVKKTAVAPNRFPHGATGSSSAPTGVGAAALARSIPTPPPTVDHVGSVASCVSSVVVAGTRRSQVDPFQT